MKVVISGEARGDLTAIAVYIARDNPARARSFAAELLGKALDIGTMPEGFPLVPGLARRGIRRRVYGRYLIFYRIESDQVTVLHVLHGARDYEGILRFDS